jgi:hypothetical protein
MDFLPRNIARQLARSGGLLIAISCSMVLAQSAPPPISRQDRGLLVADSDKIKQSSQSLKRMREVMGEVFGKLKKRGTPTTLSKLLASMKA